MEFSLPLVSQKKVLLYPYLGMSFLLEVSSADRFSLERFLLE